MATIGRNAAVAEIGPLRLRGRLAWFAWLFLHLVLLTGFRACFAVFINWVWSYVFHDRPIRLMTGQGSQAPMAQTKRCRLPADGRTGPRRQIRADDDRTAWPGSWLPWMRSMMITFRR